MICAETNSTKSQNLNGSDASGWERPVRHFWRPMRDTHATTSKVSVAPDSRTVVTEVGIGPKHGWRSIVVPPIPRCRMLDLAPCTKTALWPACADDRLVTLFRGRIRLPQGSFTHFSSCLRHFSFLFKFLCDFFIPLEYFADSWSSN